jgi:hypothetical protein
MRIDPAPSPPWCRTSGINAAAAAAPPLDPPAEAFEPLMAPHERLRIYVLKGKRTVLAWCRDSRNTWESELQRGERPELLRGLEVDLGAALAGHKAANAHPGAARMLGLGAAKLAAFPAVAWGLDVAALRARVAADLARLDAGGDPVAALAADPPRLVMRRQARA